MAVTPLRAETQQDELDRSWQDGPGPFGEQVKIPADQDVCVPIRVTPIRDGHTSNGAAGFLATIPVPGGASPRLASFGIQANTPGEGTPPPGLGVDPKCGSHAQRVEWGGVMCSDFIEVKSNTKRLRVE